MTNRDLTTTNNGLQRALRPCRSTAKSPTAFAANGRRALRRYPICRRSARKYLIRAIDAIRHSPKAAPFLAQLEIANGDLSNYMTKRRT